jgi:hypothetical protein
MTGLGLGFGFEILWVEVFGLSNEFAWGLCRDQIRTQDFCGLIGFVMKKQGIGRVGKKILRKRPNFHRGVCRKCRAWKIAGQNRLQVLFIQWLGFLAIRVIRAIFFPSISGKMVKFS